MSLHETAADVAKGIQDWSEKLTAVDVAFLLIAAAVLFWVWLAVRAATVIGPIQVDVLTHDGSDENAPHVQALTGLLRERLAAAGLSPPPQVPSGAPRTDLISAVAGSGLGQAAWVAKLLDAIPRPRPPQYELSATLLPGLPPKRRSRWSAPIPPTGFDRPAVRFWLKPAPDGAALLATVYANDHEDAVKFAAAKIFCAITQDAVHVFPPWARWRSSAANVAFVDGVEALAYVERPDKDTLMRARASFDEAARLEPTNILPRLQRVNLDERAASAVPGEDDAPQIRLVRLAAVLRAYLDLAMEHTELAEPRYRAGIVAGMLASGLKQVASDDDTLLRQVVSILRFEPQPPSMEAAIDQLERLSSRESNATYALLRVWYVLVSRQRLRNRFEPRGFARRQLATTIRISQMSRFARRSPGQAWTPMALIRRVAVRVVFLWLSRVTCGWQAFYTAGCFYAQTAGPPREPARRPDDPPSDTSRWRRAGLHLQTWCVAFVEARRSNRDARLRKRAYRCLNHAYEEGDNELQTEWLIVGDPDLEPLREYDDPLWRLLVQRVKGNNQRVIGYPSSPWLVPELRMSLWGLAAPAIAAAAVLAPLGSSHAWTEPISRIALLLLAGYAGYRAFRAYREIEFDGAADATSSTSPPADRAGA